MGAMHGADIELPSDITPAAEPGRATAARPARPAAPPRKPALPHAETNSAPETTQPHAVGAPPSGATDQLLVGRQQIALRLYDQAIQSLRKVADGPDRQQAIDAAFLIASVHETRGDVANAMGAYVEIATRFPEDPRAAEALLRLAGSTLKSKRRDGAQEAARVLTQLVAKYPASAAAPRALLMRGDIEAQQGGYQRDEVLGGSTPTAAVTYREVIDRYASSDAATDAFNKLARIYANAKRFEIAAATFQMLGARDAADKYDAWFAAGELFDKRLKDKARAREAYSHVPPSSPHYAEARKRLGSVMRGWRRSNGTAILAPRRAACPRSVTRSVSCSSRPASRWSPSSASRSESARTSPSSASSTRSFCVRCRITNRIGSSD